MVIRAPNATVVNVISAPAFWRPVLRDSAVHSSATHGSLPAHSTRSTPPHAPPTRKHGYVEAITGSPGYSVNGSVAWAHYAAPGTAPAAGWVARGADNGCVGGGAERGRMRCRGTGAWHENQSDGSLPANRLRTWATVQSYCSS